jgi:glutathione synthase/RimK-type ligase-like ATP-grasp enzyme
VNHVAIATCRGENIDIDNPLLLAALAAEGLEATMCVWDDPDVDWESFDVTVIRSTWDYSPRRAHFLEWARARTNLLNPYEAVVYSSDKHYLADLAARGVPVVPTTFCEIGETPVFPDVDFVVKPAVGAGSIDADRYRAHETARALAHVAALHAKGRSVVIQPYVHTVDIFGEHAMIFIDGEFSHAMAKGAMLNTPADVRDALFRREQMTRDVIEPDALALAAQLLVGPFANLLYARVDVVAAPSGWQLMELELVEPSLFLTFEPAAADRLAAAIKARLA